MLSEQNKNTQNLAQRNMEWKEYWGKRYEKYIFWKYKKEGYIVEECGGYHDRGIDLVAVNPKDGEIVLIQCKYWKDNKSIKNINAVAFYGACAAYIFEKDYDIDKTRGVLAIPASSRLTKQAILFFARINRKNKKIKLNARFEVIKMEKKISRRTEEKDADTIPF